MTLQGGTRLRLEAGAHDSPYDGVCVVELASVLAGEVFSDHPGCVCEVIAGFLRSWNDRAGHFNRQRLIPYASRVVGTRADREVTRIRRDICLSWAGSHGHRGRLRRPLARLAMRVRIAVAVGVRSAIHLNRGAGEYAARVAFAREDVDAGFALLDELIAVGGERGHNGASANGHRRLDPGQLVEYAPVNGNGSGAGAAAVNGNGHRPAKPPVPAAKR